MATTKLIWSKLFKIENKWLIYEVGHRCQVTFFKTLKFLDNFGHCEVWLWATVTIVSDLTANLWTSLLSHGFCRSLCFPGTHRATICSLSPVESNTYRFLYWTPWPNDSSSLWNISNKVWLLTCKHSKFLTVALLRAVSRPLWSWVNVLPSANPIR